MVMLPDSGISVGITSLQVPDNQRSGGARSLALTLLRENFLLTGKNTGNLRFLGLENRTSHLQLAHPAGVNH
jgi:hypothetical protein